MKSQLKEGGSIGEKPNSNFKGECSLQKEYTLGEFSKIFPALLCVDQFKGEEIKYEKYVEDEKSETLLERIIKGNPCFVKRLFVSDFLQYNSAPLIQSVQTKDERNGICYFQKVQINSNVEQEWMLSSTTVCSENNQVLTVSQVVVGSDQTTEVIKRLLDDSLHYRSNMEQFLRLTKREKEVFECVVQELTSKQIAEKLCVSYHTITTHRKNIGKKLKLTSVSEWKILANAFEMM